MRYITSEEISELGISPSTCVEWVREAFIIKRKSILPPKISIHPQGSDFINTMPCLMPDSYHRFGCKVVSRIAGAKQALKSDMILMDSKSGETIAMLNADWITAMRTGAVATLAIETFEKSDAKIYSFIGLGVIGNATLDCFLERNSNRQVVVRLKKYKHHAEDAIKKYKYYHNVRFEIAETMDDLIEDSDVIVSCITEAKDLLVVDTSKLKPGILLVPVHTRGFQN